MGLRTQVNGWIRMEESMSSSIGGGKVNEVIEVFRGGEREKMRQLPFFSRE